MFNMESKKTVSKIILSFILIMMTLLSGCQKNTTDSAIEFGTIDVSEIDKIELSGTTGGKDGNYSYTLSDQEKKEFVHLLNQVELGDEVDKIKHYQVEQLLTISFISKEKTSLHSVRDIISVLMKSIMSLLISINCGMNLSLSIVNKIPLSKTNGIVLLLAQKPLRQITM